MTKLYELIVVFDLQSKECEKRIDDICAQDPSYDKSQYFNLPDALKTICGELVNLIELNKECKNDNDSPED